MKIALIQPAKPNDRSQAATDWSLCKPLSLLYLSSSIQNSTLHTCELIDFERMHATQGDVDVKAVVESLECDVFGVTATTFTRHEAINLIKIIRNIHPSKKIIVGGVHFMHCDFDTLNKLPEVDVVVRGEGEKVIVDLLNAFQASSSLKEVQGITFRDQDGKICKTADPEIFEDLDLVDVSTLRSPSEYPEFLMGPKEPIPAVSIMTSRGCPFRCVFCAKAGVKYRHRSAQSVVAELKYYVEHHGITAFNFLDLTFTANPQRSRELCQAIIDEGLNVQWWCETRANVPLDLISLMRQAGCRFIVVGVETGSEAILKRIQKGVTLRQVEALFSYTRKVGIQTTAYFMLSHVGETYTDALKTLKFLRKVEKKYQVNTTLQPCMIFPGTEIETIAKDRGLLPESFSWADEFYEPLNANVGQVTTIPLFLDLLTREQLSDILLLRKKMREIHYRYQVITFSYIKEAYKVNGLKKMLSILVNDLIAFALFGRFAIKKTKLDEGTTTSQQDIYVN